MSDLEAEGQARLKDSRAWKHIWEPEVRECMFFAAPHRQRMVSSNTSQAQRPIKDEGELNTDLAMELCGDFATEVINTFMPREQDWCERGPGEGVADDAFDAVKDQVKAGDKMAFRALRASNFYPAVAMAFDPELSIGTVALWSERPHPSKPINWTAIPLRELEINRGPNGDVDDRFRVRQVRNTHVRELLGAEIYAKIPDKAKKIIENKKSDKTDLTWGFWRLWDDVSDECWQHVVYYKTELIHEARLKGCGCCPVTVMRWNPNMDWPFGHGPLMQGRPSLRQIDELEIMRMVHTDIAARPPLGFPDDSFANIESGLEPGMAVPVRPGSEGAIKALYEAPPSDPTRYAYEEKERRLRRMFFVDFPQQSGDTPPTAAQWLDELARAQRRIGRPGLCFWSEGPAQVFQRTIYLLEKGGAIPPIQANGRAIALVPLNPTQRAAEQQEIAMAVQGMQIAAQFLPEEFKMWVDGKMTMEALFDKMRINGLVKMRSKGAVQTAINQISQLAGGAQPGAQGVPVPGGAA